MNYQDHEYMVQPARSYAQLWRTLLGFVLGFAIYAILAMMFVALFGALSGDIESLLSFADPEAQATPAGTLMMLFSFVCMTGGIVIATLALHRRGLLSLLGPFRMMAADFLRVLGVLMLLSIVLLMLPLPSGPDETPVQNLDTGLWLKLLPIAILGVLIQTSAEEIVFRGYLQSQLAARFASPLIWMIVPSVIFGLMHFSPEMAGDNTWFIVGWATLFGVIAADLTARAGNLGPAIAMHFLNNLIAITFISTQGPLSGVALYTYPFGMADAEIMAHLPQDFATIVVGWLAARVAISR
ncbi:CPBP family intramembrane glutamic endopeptidase [Parasulfitobacter algicola]|uniref:CPBP family intramembrane metalloprotease n=1 Tax=Parasulfitobacter algicola TaxID=2614809 RepID=A0ABX2IWH0_9RHOB|nr:CPBP family intramembrane glutamic endopeptidase [Sulfitobacter algicola]NSX54583.1 CPBP family intramembrane metalloprotease [Sulfitobacter algicola]